ncbi:MAG: hypothetical protein OXC07_07880 [Kistimonas sp.]|nr:hypothetical protein [Kistimonas sp.]
MNTNHVDCATALTCMPLPGKRRSSVNGEPWSQGRVVRQHLVAASPYLSADVGKHSPTDAEPQTSRPLTISMAAIGARDLPVNYLSKGHSPLKGLVPEPNARWQEELVAAFKRDSWWKQDAWGDDSLRVYQKWVSDRRRLEPGEEFRFERLMSTLENMQTFVRHIRANKQFAEPLTPAEDKAMAWVEDKTAELLAAHAPYKRTVYLAAALMVLCEIVTDRQVLAPLKQKRPELFDRHVERITRRAEYLMTDDPDDPGSFSASRLDPEWVASLCWGGNNPEGQDENVQLLARYCQIDDGFKRMLDNPEAVVFPNFDALSLEDFCRFSHLPVYPIGMITTYAINADGIMMSPLVFFLHDIGHMQRMRLVGMGNHAATASVLARPVQRLAWRRLLLDETRRLCVASQKVNDACALLLFQFLHEEYPVGCASSMKSVHTGFLFCLTLLAEARRRTRNGYEDIYQSVTDGEAAIAALWAVRLWTQWQAGSHQPVDKAQLRACAQRFVAEDARQLQRHLDFMETHRGVLRHLFIERCRPSWMTDDIESVRFPAELAKCKAFYLFQTHNAFGDIRNLDNTDLGYFAALPSAELRKAIAQRTGAAVPEPGLFGPDPVPAPEVMNTAPGHA